MLDRLKVPAEEGVKVKVAPEAISILPFIVVPPVVLILSVPFVMIRVSIDKLLPVPFLLPEEILKSKFEYVLPLKEGVSLAWKRYQLPG